MLRMDLINEFRNTQKLLDNTNHLIRETDYITKDRIYYQLCMAEKDTTSEIISIGQRFMECYRMAWTSQLNEMRKDEIVVALEKQEIVLKDMNDLLSKQLAKIK